MGESTHLYGSLTPEEQQAAGDAAEAVRCFRLIAYVAQRLRYRLDQHLREDGLTTQQGFLLTIVRSHGRPTLGEVAKAMSTTHQNAKQVAAALERKGMLTIIPDEGDQRVKRLVATKAGRRGWVSRNREDFAAVGSWFASLSAKQRQDLASLLSMVARDLS
jgi:DNA-binding MarR family transcriptional regulator